MLFRASFRDGKVGAPEQLSSARWSCQYPLPSARALIATCLVDGTLDVFGLPLAGAVPPAWTAAAVAAPPAGGDPGAGPALQGQQLEGPPGGEPDPCPHQPLGLLVHLKHEFVVQHLLEGGARGDRVVGQPGSLQVCAEP